MSETAGLGAFGTLFQVGSDPSSTFTTVAEITGLSGPGFSTDDLDMTHHESPNAVKEYLAGLREGGEVTFDVNFIPTNATHSSVTDGLTGLWLAGAKRTMQIVWPDPSTTTYSFPGYIKGIDHSEDPADKLAASITVKVAGTITFT